MVNNDHYPFKVVMLQEHSGTGQTNIVSRFCYDAFNPSINTTIGWNLTFRKKKYNDSEIKFQIWDTATQYRFRSGRLFNVHKKGTGISTQCMYVAVRLL